MSSLSVFVSKNAVLNRTAKHGIDVDDADLVGVLTIMHSIGVIVRNRVEVDYPALHHCIIARQLIRPAKTLAVFQPRYKILIVWQLAV